MPLSRSPLETPRIVIEDDGHICAARFADRDWVCPRCRGAAGVVAKDANGYEIFEECECVAARRRLELFNAARIGRRYKDATLESFKPQNPAQILARERAQDFTLMYPAVNRGYTFVGPVGTGKTHLVIGIFRKLTLEKGVPCRFVDYSHLVKDLRRSYETGEGESVHVVPLFNVEVLLIDELGRGRRTEWELTVLDDLISRRYNAGKITLCTTNFEVVEDRGTAVRKVLNAAHEARLKRSATAHAFQSLQDRMDVRIFSRLSEMCEFVEVPGEDYRLRT
jgi:DNA replication protein DnaC